MTKERIIIMMVCMMVILITISIGRILRRLGGDGSPGTSLFRPSTGKKRGDQKPEPGNFVNYFMIILALISIILMLMFPKK
jgi:hypothetical protein